MTRYAVVTERAEDGGYGIWCPDLPGCVALADTESEALSSMRKAIELHIAGLREDGLRIPHPASISAAVINRPSRPRSPAVSAITLGLLAGPTNGRCDDQ